MVKNVIDAVTLDIMRKAFFTKIIHALLDSGLIVYDNNLPPQSISENRVNFIKEIGPVEGYFVDIPFDSSKTGDKALICRIHANGKYDPTKIEIFESNASENELLFEHPLSILTLTMGYAGKAWMDNMDKMILQVINKAKETLSDKGIMITTRPIGRQCGDIVITFDQKLLI